MQPEEGSVKTEETLELSISNHDNNLTNTTEVISIKVEEADNKEYLCRIIGHFRVQSVAQ